MAFDQIALSGLQNSDEGKALDEKLRQKKEEEEEKRREEREARKKKGIAVIEAVIAQTRLQVVREK